MILFYLILAADLTAAIAQAPLNGSGQPLLDIRFSMDRTQVIVGAAWTTPDALPGTLLGDNLAALAYMNAHAADWYDMGDI